MNHKDLEWRGEVRKKFGKNLMPEVYPYVWELSIGKKLAIKVKLKRIWKKFLKLFGIGSG